MKKLISMTALLLVGGAAHAGTFDIGGGDWISTASWNANATGNPNTLVYDNGATVPGAISFLGPVPWSHPLGTPDDPEDPQSATYSGTLVFDDGTGEVTGGTLVMTGVNGMQTQNGPNDWWYWEYTNIVIDFAAGTAVGSSKCYDTGFAPAECSGIDITPPNFWEPDAGNEGLDGTARVAAHWDGSTLQIFNERYNALEDGTDYLHTFELTAIPVPAAVWLFGSALGLLGWARRRSA